VTTLVTRAQWGARAREEGETSITDHPSTTFHYVGGGWEYPWDHSSCDDKVRGIQRDHMDNRGWSDIAYNYLVCPHDFVYEGRGYDRRSAANGSNSANYASFAVCALWGTESADDPLTNGMKDAFLYAHYILRIRGGATAVIRGHRDWKSTDCPGDQIYAWIQAGCPDPTPTVIYEDAKVDAGMALSLEAQRQIAAVMSGVLDQEVVDGQSLHELVQKFSAFNAENTRQNVDQAERAIDEVDTEVELVLKDDFASINTRLASLENSYNDIKGQLATLIDLVRQQS